MLIHGETSGQICSFADLSSSFLAVPSFPPTHEVELQIQETDWKVDLERGFLSSDGSLERAILACCPLTRVRHSSHSLMLDLANVLCQISFSDRTLKWFVDPPGIKPKTFHLFVKYVNHYTTEPLSHITQRGRKKMHQSLLVSVCNVPVYTMVVYVGRCNCCATLWFFSL